MSGCKQVMRCAVAPRGSRCTGSAALVASLYRSGLGHHVLRFVTKKYSFACGSLCRALISETDNIRYHLPFFARATVRACTPLTPTTCRMEEQLLARIRRSQQLLRMPLHPLPTSAGGGPQLQRPRPAPRAESLTLEAHLLLARCMRQWRRALAERHHVERGRRMERLLKTLTVRENQSRGHVVAEATTEPLQPTPEPLPRSEADCPDSPKQHTPPTPLPQPRRPTLAVNGGGCGGAVRLGESALLDASGRPARRGGRCEARRGDSGEAEPPGTESEGEADEAGAEGAASTCRAASAMLGLSWRANSSRAPRPASLSPAATAAVPRTAAATVDADADDACATRGACSLASAFEAAATERPERPAGASADHDGSALELGLVALRRLINATPSGGRSSSGGRDNLASRVLEPESERQATSSASPSSPPPSSPPPSSPPPSSPPPSCPPTAIRQPHDRGRESAETPPQQGGAPLPQDCGSAAATATAAAAEVAGAGAGAGVVADTGRDVAAGRRGDGALLAIRLQVRADERRSRRLDMQRKQQQAQQASKAAAQAAQAVQAAREVAARRERAAEVRAEREATDRKRELLVYRAKQARQPSPTLLLHSHLHRPPSPPPQPALPDPGACLRGPRTQALTMGAVPRCDAGATRRPARRARTSRPSRLASLARPGARGGLQHRAARHFLPHPKRPVSMHASRQIPSPPFERLP